MEHLDNVVGAAVLSLFVVANIYAMYLYLKAHLSLAPDSRVNHAIVQRFRTTSQLIAYHWRVDAETMNKASGSLAKYRQIFLFKRGFLDPSQARIFPDPDGAFCMDLYEKNKPLALPQVIDLNRRRVYEQ